MEQIMPAFLSDRPNTPLHKYMFLKKNGKATHPLGDVSRDCLDAELICISDETETEWIGNFAEGYGLFGVHFAKEDCRDANEREVIRWMLDRDSVKFKNKQYTIDDELLYDLQKKYDEMKETYNASKDMSFYFYYQGLGYAIEKLKEKIK